MKLKSYNHPILFELLIFGALLLVANVGLLSGQPRRAWLLMPGAVMQGEWWRLVLHPWVHASGYHLLLDASAFLLLFGLLARDRCRDRWIILLGAWMGQCAAVWLGEPRVEMLGLGGLSGVAHGLFAAVCVQWCQQQGVTKIGRVLLLGVLLKAVLEVFSGRVTLAGIHFGTVGIPLTLCHGGGVLGGILAARLVNQRQRFRQVESVATSRRRRIHAAHP